MGTDANVMVITIGDGWGIAPAPSRVTERGWGKWRCGASRAVGGPMVSKGACPARPHRFRCLRVVAS